MFRSRITQGIAGATLSLLGLSGLVAISSEPAVAEEHAAEPDDMSQQHMDEMVVQCTQMMQTMSNMDERGVSNMMGGDR